MLSRSAAARKVGQREGFVWRGREISRIEGLSDAVFAFAVTLLIVSTEVPKTYAELLLRLGEFVPFAACFSLLMTVWYQHYLFHRRYGLEDLTSSVYTMILLFLVLFYTYPLKFMFMSWIGVGSGYVLKSTGELAGIFTIYGIGFVAVYILFFLMYFHAYQKRVELKLTELEVWDTRHTLRDIVLTCLVGGLSIAVANTVPGEIAWLAGPAYALLGPISWAHGSWSGKRRQEIFERLATAG